ncbi:MAG: CYTH domain-containing protein [Eubacterium sp.]|nr:CYTH domain-containing protein [Eubacterium sp.]
MEIELKYVFDDPAIVDQLFSDEKIRAARDQKAEQIIPMHAVYYDTADRDLRQEHIAYRIRREGKNHVCTVKWDGSSENGMHRRNEINVPVCDRSLIEEPTVDLFQQSEVWERLNTITGNKKLVPLLDMRFDRREVRLDTGRSISVFSVDQGEIIGNGKTLPLLELEIELFSGDEEDILRIGDYISEKYGLKPENRSKFERGYALVQE